MADKEDNKYFPAHKRQNVREVSNLDVGTGALVTATHEGFQQVAEDIGDLKKKVEWLTERLEASLDGEHSKTSQNGNSVKFSPVGRDR